MVEEKEIYKKSKNTTHKPKAVYYWSTTEVVKW